MLLTNRQHWNTPDEMHLRFSIIINLLYLKPVGLKCYHHPKPLKRAKTQRGRVRGETSNQSPAPKTPGHSTLQFKHCHSHPGWLKPSPTERQRLAAGPAAARGARLKIRDRKFGDLCDISVAALEPPPCPGLPTGIREVSTWESSSSPGEQAQVWGSAGSWLVQRWHSETKSWQVVKTEISSALRHCKNHLRKQVILTMKLLLLKQKC